MSAPVPAAPQPPHPGNPQPAFAPAPPPRSKTGVIIGSIAAVVFLTVLGIAAYIALTGPKLTPNGAANSSAPAATSSTASSATPSSAPTAPANAESGQPVGGEVIKFVTAAANIRNVATAQGGAVVGTLRRGEQVKGAMVPGLSPGTFWFKLSDGRGFVSSVNLGDADPGPAPAPVVAVRAPVANAPFCSVSTASGNLRIRSSPNGAIIGGMPRGARFQAYNGTHDGYGNYWMMVQPVEARYPAGWVSGDYVVC